MKKNYFQSISILAIICLFIIILSTAVFMTLKNTSDLSEILNDSVKSQLISISIAARELVDPDKFDSYNSLEDVEADMEAFSKTLADLRSLREKVGAKYIYALKQLNHKYYFIFDSDTEDYQLFTEYEISSVHEQAFLGYESADIMNMTDEWGSFNTGSVPIWKDGKVIGIICADTEDTFVQKSKATARTNAIYLILSMSASMCVIIITVILLLRRLGKMQNKLFRMANYDVITGLPNRQFLMNYLAEISEKAIKTKSHFALFFIDLDNFKRVNDNAGHDAGDELLHDISLYLDNIHANSKSFRPSAGILNISARIGGDEFVQIIPGVSNEYEAASVAQKIIDNFTSQSLDRFIEKYQVGLSIGVALFPNHTNNYNVLIKYADIAMYHSKREGKNTFRVYNDTMSKSAEE